MDRLEEALANFMAVASRIPENLYPNIEKIRASDHRTDRQFSAIQQKVDVERQKNREQFELFPSQTDWTAK